MLGTGHRCPRGMILRCSSGVPVAAQAERKVYRLFFVAISRILSVCHLPIRHEAAALPVAKAVLRARAVGTRHNRKRGRVRISSAAQPSWAHSFLFISLQRDSFPDSIDIVPAPAAMTVKYDIRFSHIKATLHVLAQPLERLLAMERPVHCLRQSQQIISISAHP